MQSSLLQSESLTKLVITILGSLIVAAILTGLRKFSAKPKLVWSGDSDRIEITKNGQVVSDYFNQIIIDNVGRAVAQELKVACAGEISSIKIRRYKRPWSQFLSRTEIADDKHFILSEHNGERILTLNNIRPKTRIHLTFVGNEPMFFTGLKVEYGDAIAGRVTTPTILLSEGQLWSAILTTWVSFTILPPIALYAFAALIQFIVRIFETS